MTQRNIDFAVRIDSHNEFAIMAAPCAAVGLLTKPLLESVDRESLRVLRNVIDQALNTSAEELGDELA